MNSTHCSLERLNSLWVTIVQVAVIEEDTAKIRHLGSTVEIVMPSNALSCNRMDQMPMTSKDIITQ